MNTKIVNSLIRAANGHIGIPKSPGLCLAFVRCVIEDALYDGKREFYRHYLVAGTTKRGGTDSDRLGEAWKDPWAADIERSMKVLGMGVPALLRKPGDLVFNYHAAAPIGHVGLLLTRDLVVENIRPTYRAGSIHLSVGSLSITPYSKHPWTLVARLRDR